MMQEPVAIDPTEGPPAVGARLQELRQSHKLTLDELSRRAGVSKSMLSQIERNQANRSRTANELGISRRALLYKLHELDLDDGCAESDACCE